MKLHRVISITEGQGPVPVKLTLAEIVRAGKVTNPYQTFVLGWLAEFFKNGMKSADLCLESPITFDSKATTTALVFEIRAMTSEEHVELARYLSDCIDQGECPLYDKDCSITDWMKFVLRKQD
jgi:hypothetical protein